MAYFSVGRKAHCLEVHFPPVIVVFMLVRLLLLKNTVAQSYIVGALT